MSEISRTGRLGFAVCAAGLVGGFALSQGTAEAAPVAKATAVERHLPFDGNNSKNNEAEIGGRKNAVSANSPTKNLGSQHNSGSNSARQISFQYALCKRTKKCRISQKVVTKRRFVGFVGPVREQWGRDAIAFPWGDTVASTRVRPSMMSLSVKSP